jgi:hypothetical protein
MENGAVCKIKYESRSSFIEREPLDIIRLFAH